MKSKTPIFPITHNPFEVGLIKQPSKKTKSTMTKIYWIVIFLGALMVFTCSPAHSQILKSDTSWNTLASSFSYEGDSSVIDSVGTKYYKFSGKEIYQDGEWAIQIHDPEGFAQYVFYNGYLFDQKYWFRGKLVDHTQYKKIIKHFKIKN